MTIKDGDGNKLEPKEIKWLLDAEILKVRDSRTGSIVDLVQLENGNFRVNAKKAGSTYILFEINDCHTSLRVDVRQCKGWRRSHQRHHLLGFYYRHPTCPFQSSVALLPELRWFLE